MDDALPVTAQLLSQRSLRLGGSGDNSRTLAQASGLLRPSQLLQADPIVPDLRHVTDSIAVEFMT